MMRIVLALLLLPFYLYSQDTTSFSDGYAIGKLNWKGDQKGWWIYYNDKDEMTEKRIERKWGKRGYRYISHNYEDSIITKGKWEWKSGNWGKIRTYDLAGNLIRINRYKCGKYHGVQKDLVSGTKKRYRYAVEKSRMYTEDNKRIVIFIGDVNPYLDWSCQERRFACKFIPGVCPKRRKKIHNFFSNIRQTLRYGSSWKKKYFQREPC